MLKDAKPYHREFRPLTRGPLSEDDKNPCKSELLNTRLWPNALIGRSLVWAYVGDDNTHRWRIAEESSGTPGFQFVLFGERVWAEVGLRPDELSEDKLLVVLASAMMRQFIRPGPPQPGVEREIALLRQDFEDAQPA